MANSSRHSLVDRVQIPTWDNDIDRSESEMACEYPNSRAPGDMSLTIKRNIFLIFRSWYYPHHFAPWITDIKNFSSMDLKFELSKPFNPFEQLLSVLPAASKELLPKVTSTNHLVLKL